MVSDLKTFVHKRCKIAAAKKDFKKKYIYLYTLFMRLFALTSQSPMSKLLESLVKVKGKKWSHIWKLLLTKGVKSPRKTSMIFGKFCLTNRIFLVLVLLSALFERCFVSCMRDFFYSLTKESNLTLFLTKARLLYQKLLAQRKIYLHRRINREMKMIN